MTPTPTQIALHQARAARLQRFAQAAIRITPVVTKPAARLMQEKPRAAVRRRYETSSRQSGYTPPLYWRIICAVADEFGLTHDEVTGSSRDFRCLIPRFVAVGLLSEMTLMSLPAIGRRLGGRDHTTILNARRRIAQLLESEAFRNRFDQIKAELA